MSKPVVGALYLMTIVLLAMGCDKEPDTSKRGRSITRRTRPTPTYSTSTAQTRQPTSQDESLYLRTMENLHRENRELKQQVADAVKMLLDMEEELKQIRSERDEAVNRANQIQGSIATLRSDALSKDQRMRELEATNQEMQSTITTLTQQVNQLLSELNTVGTTATTNP